MTGSRIFNLLLQSDNQSWEWRCLVGGSRHIALRLGRWSQQLSCCSVSTWGVRGGVPARSGHRHHPWGRWESWGRQRQCQRGQRCPSAPAAAQSSLCSTAGTLIGQHLHTARRARGCCTQFITLHVLEYNWHKKWPTSQKNDKMLLAMLDTLHLPFFICSSLQSCFQRN